eukprot:13021590-Ditylum_brightwellii.AAC.1
MQTIYALSYNTNQGSPPEHLVVDYKQDANPYVARYGNNWRNVIRGTTGMKKYVHINVLVQHMHDETEKAFKETTHELTWNFYHDAFSLMSSKECHQHMTEVDIMKKWILPENGLNRGLNYENKLV